jgi:hypothetical protein
MILHYYVLFTETGDVPLNDDDVATDVTPEQRAQVTFYCLHVKKLSKYNNWLSSAMHSRTL